MSDSDSDGGGTPPEIMKEAQQVISNLLPTKSKHLYDKTYQCFKTWCQEMGATQVTENVLLSYFSRKAAAQKSSTLWTRYSMLRSTLNLYDGVDISKFPKLLAFLKRQSTDYKPKKSKILTRDEVERFLTKASDDFLLIKVGAIFGICGACRSDELVKLKTSDIQDLGSSLLVSVRNTKTRIDRVFTVVEKAIPNYLELYRRYAKLRPSHTPHDRFFVFYKNGKCTTQPVGKNTIGKFAYNIAKYLKLETPTAYTGHCFRRSSATMLVESGGDLLTLKRHGGWQSSNVAEGYIESSTRNKVETAMKIMGVDSTPCISEESGDTEEKIEITRQNPRTGDKGPVISISNCQNCQINIKID